MTSARTQKMAVRGERCLECCKISVKGKGRAALGVTEKQVLSEDRCNRASLRFSSQFFKMTT